MRMKLSTAVVAALTLGAAGAQGQTGPAATGASVTAGRDNNWDVSVGAGAFVDAFQVTSDPGWYAFDGSQGARWISATASGSGASTGAYRFQTTFDLTGYNPATAVLNYQCSIDNTYISVALNGTVIGGNTCSTWTTISAVQTISSNFVSGVNTLTFSTTGDTSTDGFFYKTTGFTARAAVSSVPEPSTYLMLATGLGALGAVARRRRKS